MLESQTLTALFKLLEDMTRPRTRISAFTPGKMAQRLERWSMRGLLGAIAIFLGLIVWERYGTPTAGFRSILLGVYVLHLSLAITYLATITIGLAPILWRHRKKPFAAMLAALERDLQEDADVLNKLWAFDKAALAYGLLQYRHRWSSFDGRISVAAGDLRKLGLFPALAAASISASTLLKEGSNIFLWAPVMLTACFYLVAFVAYASRERPQQVIELLEYAIHHADQFASISSEIGTRPASQKALSSQKMERAGESKIHTKPFSSVEGFIPPCTELPQLPCKCCQIAPYQR
ncbi:hypothetical protein [Stenotrophomonas sp. MYb57]|uniref:hypothetical protein n=1 Tax=Stenotrophomonas sp. MYb57 TaxID=1827305 RepID=UPI001319D3AD|nr:hypothetical protein [Stenotrophomonas sp. MYb57]